MEGGKGSGPMGFEEAGYSWGMLVGSGLEVNWTNEMGEWERVTVREDSGMDVFLGET